VAGLLRVAHVARLDLRAAIHHKLALNRKKYPVEMCKGKAGKYTQYSSATGITKTEGQSVDMATTDDQDAAVPFADWWYPALEAVVQFREERDWTRYHQPRSLGLALLGELGELAEILQFDNEDLTEISAAKYEELFKELADVTIYTISLVSYYNDNEAYQPQETPFVTEVLQRVQEELNDIEPV